MNYNDLYWNKNIKKYIYMFIIRLIKSVNWASEKENIKYIPGRVARILVRGSIKQNFQ